MKVTALGDVITAVVAAIGAVVTYPVSDGPFTKRPARGVTGKYLAIGAEEPYVDEDGNPLSAGSMQQTWKGLGQVARDEELQIPCCAIGKAASVSAARALAEAAMQDIFDNLGKHPTSDTYNALVSEVSGVDSRPVAGGAVVTIHFVISASARLM
jgi:hypothetical protein